MMVTSAGGSRRKQPDDIRQINGRSMREIKRQRAREKKFGARIAKTNIELFARGTHWIICGRIDWHRRRRSWRRAGGRRCWRLRGNTRGGLHLLLLFDTALKCRLVSVA